MHLRHVASHHLQRWTRRYPILGRFTVVTTILTFIWIYAIWQGERSIFASHIDACRWERWEKWPAGSTPHHLVLIADPQLVDPHTYPGRPWPLSSLTEIYTDMYMARNFRLINVNFDPDSIVFLGDLLDGGREWATSRARPLKEYQKARLKALGVIESGRATWKREEQEQTLEEEVKDLRAFVHGENGRWKKWDQRQWDTDFERFGRIFLDHDQLYPHTNRTPFAAYEISPDPVSAENGAPNVSWREYATSGGKQRRVIMSLPGNHDLGFGDGIQLSVRDRFQSHFGDTNRVDVIGNHTFISLDAPSLSAAGQYIREGGETRPGQIKALEHIWKPTSDFLKDLRAPTGKIVANALHQYYPDEHKQTGHPHAVTHAGDVELEDPEDKIAASDAEAPPQLPVILLTHVPLFRDPDTDCGRLREKGKAISVSAGYQYQNVLTQTLSNTVINRISAVGDVSMAFSGDDHDYCDVTHRYNVESLSNDKIKGGSRLQHVREVTVKSFSWAMGVRKPGFQLVSLWNPVDAMGETVGTPLPTIQTHLCLLPDQLTTFINYALLLAATLVVLLVRAIVLSLRSSPATASDDAVEDTASRFELPRFEPKLDAADTNGYATPTKNSNSESKGRHRASSTSTSNQTSSNGNLGVQRSYTARTRSVSPAASYNPGNGGGLANVLEEQHNGPLIDRAGYYPQVRWADPDEEEDSDEESHIGDGEDSQAKWKRRRRTPGKMSRFVSEVFTSLLVVAMPACVFYGYLIRHG